MQINGDSKIDDSRNLTKDVCSGGDLCVSL